MKRKIPSSSYTILLFRKFCFFVFYNTHQFWLLSCSNVLLFFSFPTFHLFVCLFVFQVDFLSFIYCCCFHFHSIMHYTIVVISFFHLFNSIQFNHYERYTQKKSTFIHRKPNGWWWEMLVSDAFFHRDYFFF